MTQVKYNDQKWWVLLNPPKESDFYVNQGSEDGYFDSLSYEHALVHGWTKIAEKDWENIKRLVWNDDDIKRKSKVTYDEWQPIYSIPHELPDEVEFEIKRTCLRFQDEGVKCDDKCYFEGGALKSCKQVAHLKDSEQKKEQATIFLNSNGKLRPFKIVPFTEQEERSIWNKNWTDLSDNSVGHDPKEGDTRLIGL